MIYVCFRKSPHLPSTQLFGPYLLIFNRIRKNCFEDFLPHFEYLCLFIDNFGPFIDYNVTFTEINRCIDTNQNDMKIFVALVMLSLAPMTMASPSEGTIQNTLEEVVMYPGKGKGKKAKRHKRINRKRKRKCSAHARRVFAG